MPENEQVEQSFEDFEKERGGDAVDPLQAILGNNEPQKDVTPAASEEPKEETQETKNDDKENKSDDFGKFRKRFERFKRQIDRKDETIEKLKEELDQAREATKGDAEAEADEKEPEKKSGKPKAPNEDDYDSTDDYMDAVEEYLNNMEEYDDVSEETQQTNEAKVQEDGEANEEKGTSEKEVVDRLAPKPGSPQNKDAWDDILEIIDDDDRVNAQMVPDLAEMIEKGQLQMSQSMIDWLATNEEKTVDVIEQMMINPRLSRRISRMTQSQMKAELNRLAEGGNEQVIKNPTSISDIRGTGSIETKDPGDMDPFEYEKMRVNQHKNENLHGLPFRYN